MNEQFDADTIAALKFAVGQPVPRSEDPILVRGAGRYTDDINLPGQAYAAMVRSAVAHGVIRGIDASAARAMPGVLAVYTGDDLQAAGYGAFPNVVALKNRDGSQMRKPKRIALATDRVRFVGDPVAFVVAASEAEARDAAEAVKLDIDELPAVTTPEAALERRRAADLRRRSRQRRARLLLRRQREDGRGLRQGRARHQARYRQQPHRRQRHGAARCHCGIRRGERSASRSMSAARACSAPTTCCPRSCSTFRRTRSASSPAMSAAPSA